MAVFTVPKYRVAELEKKIEKIRRKGVDVIFDIVNPDINHAYRGLEWGMLLNIPCVAIEVSGEYIINGWAFVGTIEHSSPENIIRIADQRFYGRIPERYRTAPRDCEHCHIKRDRTDTYLIYKEDEDEWKQVGRTCLKNYTQGLDAEVCAAMSDVFSEIKRMHENTANNVFRDINFDDLQHFDDIGFSSSRIRKKIVYYIKVNGYIPVKTVLEFKKALFEKQNLTECSDEEVDQITAAAQDLIVSDWSRNAIAAWNKEYIEVRDFNLIASLCHVCLDNIAKEIARRSIQADPTNAYAGEVGDVVEFVITSAVVAYTRIPSAYYASSYPVYKLTDEQGRVYNWGCTNDDVVVEPGKHIKGRIKAIFERKNGEKVTELTRCKVW